MQRSQGRSETLIIAGQATKTSSPGKITLDHPAPRQEHKAPFGFRQFDHRQLDAVLGGRRSRLLTGVALVHIRQLDVFAGDRLDGHRQFLDLRALLLVGWGHQQRQEVSQGIHRDMDLGALAALVPVIFPARAPLSGVDELERAPVQNGGARRLRTIRGAPQQDTQIVHDRLKRAGRHPAAHLLVYQRPRRQIVEGIMRQCAPVFTR